MRPLHQSPTGLADFLEYELLPALWLRLDLAFPEFGFRQKGRYWQATDETATRALPGGPRPDRVQAYENTPFGFQIHGGEFVTWLSYVAEETAPRGQQFIEAVRELAERAAVPFPERQLSPEELRQAEERDRKATLLETALSWARAALQSDAGAPARAYLQQRGFAPDHVHALEFGLYTTAHELLTYLTDHGFGVEEVREAGLVPPAFDTGQAAINLWPDRLLGPWRDRAGRIINLWARDLAPDSPDDKKYLMLRGGSKASPFGIDKACGPHLVLVEGFLDCLALLAHGQENVVALGGAALSHDQVQHLCASRLRSLTLNLDYDGPAGAGHRGTLQALDSLTDAPFKVYVVAPVLMAANGNVDAKVDPDAFLRQHDLPAYQSLLSKATKGALYRAEAILQQHDLTTDRGRDAALDDLLDYVARLNDELDREDVCQLAAERTGYPYDTLSPLIQEHAQRTERDRRRLRLAQIMDQSRRDIQDPASTPEQVAAALLQSLSDFHRETLDQAPEPFSVDATLDSIRHAQAGKISGWDALDSLDVRLHPQELVVIGARTGHGKTTALLSLLLNWLGTYPDEAFIFFSYEIPPDAVLLKLASAITRQHGDDGWTYYEIRDWLRSKERAGRFPDPHALEAAFDTLRACEHRLSVVCQPDWPVTQLAALANRLADQGAPVGGVLVDYLQLIPPPTGDYDRRDIEVSHVARQLKALAVALACPVVAAAQIGRQAAQQGERIPPGEFEDSQVQEAIRRRRPQLHHLREGGSEQEADLVLGLLNYRADYLEELDDVDASKRTQPGPLEILVLKNRYGPLGSATLMLEGHTGTIRSLEPYDAL